MRVIDHAYAGAVSELRESVRQLQAFVDQLPAAAGEEGAKACEVQDWELVGAVNSVKYSLVEALRVLEAKGPEVHAMASRYEGW